MVETRSEHNARTDEGTRDGALRFAVPAAGSVSENSKPKPREPGGHRGRGSLLGAAAASTL